MTNTALLRELVKQSGLKYNYIAKKLNMSIQALWHKINNDNEFKASEIAAFCDLLDIDLRTREKVFFARK